LSEQLVKRLRELSNAVTRADWNEFSMRIPAEKDRDADFVLLQAANKIAALEADAARMDWIQKNLLCADWEYPQGEKNTQPVICISWTIRASAVTCEKCLKILKERGPIQPDKKESGE